MRFGRRLARGGVAGICLVLAAAGAAAQDQTAPPADAAAPAQPALPDPNAPRVPIVPPPMKPDSSPFPLDRTFVAVSYKDQSFKDDRPTLLVSSSYRGSGFSACNNWSATVIPRADQRMAVGPVAVTKRTCDQRLMHNEQVFLFVLRTSQSWFYDGRTLTLNGPYGQMTFQPAV